jgi:hypothetical protein
MTPSITFSSSSQCECETETMLDNMMRRKNRRYPAKFKHEALSRKHGERSRKGIWSAKAMSAEKVSTERKDLLMQLKMCFQ